MKKIILVLFSLLLIVFTTSGKQLNTGKHLEFMGIEIAGNVDDFANKLESKGFKIILNENSTITMHGMFINEEAFLFLKYSNKSKIIYSVGVAFNSSNSYSYIESRQDDLVKLYTNKYGDPIGTIRKFASPYNNIQGNGIFRGFYKGECMSSDAWLFSNGGIMIFIQGTDYDKAAIMISYKDTKGEQIISEESLDEI